MSRSPASSDRRWKLIGLDQVSITKQGYCLFAVLAIAFGLRVWGITFGLPEVYHTDEWVEVKRALKLGIGLLESDRAIKGGYFYLLFIEFGLYYAVLKLFGLIETGYEFVYQLFRDPSTVWVIGRSTTALIGVLNCYLVFLIGRNNLSARVGVIAAAALATSSLHVESSHYITVDVPLTCLVTLCFVIMSVETARWRSTKTQYGLLGVAAGLATMVKLPGAVVVLAVLVHHYFVITEVGPPRRISTYILDQKLWLFWACFMGTYFVGNPGLLHELGEVVYTVEYLFGTGRDVPPPPAYPHLYHSETQPEFYIKALFSPWNVVLNALIISGCAVSLIAIRRKVDVAMFAFAGCYAVLLGTTDTVEHMYSRYVLPVIPPLAYYAAVGVDRLYRLLAVKSWHPVTLTCLILLAALLPEVRQSFSFDIDRTKPDTRTLAKNWIETNITTNRWIVIEGQGISPSTQTVPLRMSPSLIDEIRLIQHPENTSPAVVAEKEQYYRAMKASLRGRPVYNLILTGNRTQLKEALQLRVGDYVVLRDKTLRAFTMDVNRRGFAEMYDLVKWINSGEFETIKVFSPDDGLVGPTIVIYRRKTT